MSGPLEVRSYRLCFDLERRIHRIDRWRLPVPWGVPLRGVVYGLLALAVVLLLSAAPVLGTVVGGLPTPLRLMVIPVGAAVGLVRWRLDGRVADRALVAVARQSLGPRTLSAYRRRRAVSEATYVPVVLARDADSGSLRRARVVGPARLAIRGCDGVRRRGRRLVVGPVQSHECRVDVDVATNQVLEVRP